MFYPLTNIYIYISTYIYIYCLYIYIPGPRWYSVEPPSKLCRWTQTCFFDFGFSACWIYLSRRLHMPVKIVVPTWQFSIMSGYEAVSYGYLYSLYSKHSSILHVPPFLRLLLEAMFWDSVTLTAQSRFFASFHWRPRVVVLDLEGIPSECQAGWGHGTQRLQHSWLPGS